MSRSMNILILVCSVILSIYSFVSVVLKQVVSKMSVSSAFNVSMEAMAIVVLAIFIGGCAFDSSENISKNKAYILFSFAILRSMFYDLMVHIVDGENVPASVGFSFLFGSLRYLVNFSVLVWFIHGFAEALQTDNNYIKIYKKITYVMRFVFLVVLIINVFHPIVFNVVDGYYVRGKYFYIFYLITALTLIGVTPLFKMSKISFGTRFANLSYVFLPMLGALLEFLIPGIAFVQFMLFVSACIVYVYATVSQEYELAREKAENESQKNAIMTSQIQPHFLYNTLTTIAFLCKTDPDNAEILTKKFSKYLRTNINFLSTKDDVTFQKELETVQNYLEIEKYRFEERLNIHYDIKASDFNLPMLSVQPIVENAVKHGICKKAEGGNLYISTREDENYNYVVVEDDGVGFNPGEKPNDGKIHVGMENVKKRLVASGCDMIVESEIGKGTKITIKIPKEED